MPARYAAARPGPAGPDAAGCRCQTLPAVDKAQRGGVVVATARPDAFGVDRPAPESPDDGQAVPARDPAAEVRSLHAQLIALERQNAKLRQSRKEQEAALARYMDFYDFSPVAYFTLAQNGVIREANLTAANYLGVPRSNLIGLRLGTFLTQETQLVFHEMHERAMDGRGKQICEATLSDTRSNRRHVRIESVALVIGQACRVVVMDISDRKRAEDALLEANRRKDEFLAMLGHELRNPLAPIRNAAEVLALQELRNEDIDWVQRTLEMQVGHIARLVDDLLDVSRIAKGKIVLRRQTVELASVVRQALDGARPLVEANGQHLAVDLPEEPVWLEVDPVRIAQALLNLLDNAAKFSPANAPLLMDAWIEGSEVAIRVRDRGPGIAPDLLPVMFDLFRQGPQGLDRAQGGLGIGLYLVSELSRLHGGRVTAESEGAGAAFTIWLPVVAAPQVEAVPPVRPARRARPLRILLVDDDRLVAYSTRKMLELQGHTVRTTPNGAEALAALGGFAPEVVLLDIGLDGMDGYETCRRLRALPAGRSLMVVAVSGYGDDKSIRRALEVGFDRYLVKPVPPPELDALLATVGGAD